MTVNQRIEALIKHLGLNPNSFSKSIGLSGNSTIARIIKGQTTPSYDTLSAICETYNWINIRWLMTGEGEMILPDQEDQVVDIEALKEKIEYQKRLIQTLQDTLDTINQNFKKNT